MQLKYTAPEHVRDVIAGLGRTEDVKFSPNNRRLAVACFVSNQIAIFEIHVSAYGTKISITDVTEISSPYLKRPHGIDFIDDETIIVANREGDATIFKLPSGGGSYKLVPIQVIRSGNVLNTPGAVSISRKGQDFCEAFICNNYVNTITRHRLHSRERCSVESSEVLLKRWLDVPDGVSVSDPWIAISNHNTHNVFLYENTGSLNEFSEPDGILRCFHHPHGLKFTSDGRFILVADTGAPYVHIYTKDGSGWRGVHSPFKSLRVLNDEDFLRGRSSIEEGGPKGIDIDNSMTIFVTTCEIQPLAFFDLEEILKRTPMQRNGAAHSSASFGEALHSCYERHYRDQGALEIKYELERQHRSNHELDQSKQELVKFINSRSWRVTAPLRWASDAWHRIVGFKFLAFAEYGVSPCSPQRKENDRR